MTPQRQELLDRLAKRLHLAAAFDKASHSVTKRIPKQFMAARIKSLLHTATNNAMKYATAYNYKRLNDREIQGYITFLSTPAAYKMVRILNQAQLPEKK